MQDESLTDVITDQGLTLGAVTILLKTSVQTLELRSLESCWFFPPDVYSCWNLADIHLNGENQIR